MNSKPYMPTQAISTVWRDGDLDGYLPVSQIQPSAPEDAALLLERCEKLVICSMTTGEPMHVWYLGEWEWLREEKTDSNVVWSQDGTGVGLMFSRVGDTGKSGTMEGKSSTALLTKAARVSTTGQGVAGLSCPRLADKSRTGRVQRLGLRARSEGTSGRGGEEHAKALILSVS
ncbi:hypothetical protein BKA70DRAFT_1220786 [Coprinopsis sp. MPI-PUGE-AT-0042]|nr:hypothetical protein BKA70DRAFT_1220786 [Coprinopsis sp. MPI-PUGE-AT-0042]